MIFNVCFNDLSAHGQSHKKVHTGILILRIGNVQGPKGLQDSQSSIEKKCTLYTHEKDTGTLLTPFRIKESKVDSRATLVQREVL